MIYYLGLEPYESRYTLQSTEWVCRAAARNGAAMVVIHGDTVSHEIHTGQVLDGVGRGVWALTQTAELLKHAPFRKDDVIWLDDMFHPGWEAIVYALAFQTEKPKIVTRCYAQSIDPDDFVHVWQMGPWMRHWEAMVNETASAIFYANEEQVSYAAAAGWKAPAYVTGLPFDKDEVRERAGEIPLWTERPLKVVFASRWDAEKQPGLFLQLARECNREVEFVILSGKPLSSNFAPVLDQAHMYAQQGLVRIADRLSKAEYYDELKTARVLVNTALQDWVSNTANEADALGCNLVVPAYRGFPETMRHDPSRMWMPWSLADLCNTVQAALLKPQLRIGQLSDHSTKALDRCFDVILDRPAAAQWRRHLEDPGYRALVRGMP